MSGRAAELDVFDVFDPSIRSDPYGVYREIRERGRVIQNPTLGFWMVTGYEECRQVLRDPVTFSSAQIGVDPVRDFLDAPTVLFSDPPDHERLRGPVQQAFTPRSITALGPRVREIARDLLETLGEDRPYDVVAELASPLPVIVIAEMMGVPPEDRDAFKRWSDAAVGFNALGTGEPLRIAELEELRGYFEGVIAERRRRPGRDLVSRLVEANEGGALSDEELLAACVLILVAGNETTTSLIANGVLALARHPDQRRLLTEDPSLLPAAVEELLRYDGAVQSTFRVTTRNAEVGGETIPAGNMVLVVLAAANRDPLRFENPDHFDVGRADAAGHLGFGFGIHHCVGAAIGRLEARVALGALLARAPGYALAQPDDPLAYGPNFFLRGLTRLEIVRESSTVVREGGPESDA